jgi:hypothetical protein
MGRNGGLHESELLDLLVAIVSRFLFGGERKREIGGRREATTLLALGRQVTPKELA